MNGQTDHPKNTIPDNKRSLKTNKKPEIVLNAFYVPKAWKLKVLNALMSHKPES